MPFKDLEQKHNLINMVILACGKHPTDADINPLLEEALAAARELRAMKPVAWAVERKVATCNEEFAELWRSNGEEVTPLYALDEVKHD